jgi:hypothetical protein
VAFLARCPDCGQFQVCVFDPEDDLNLMCQACRAVFPAVWEDTMPASGDIEFSLAMTLCDYEYEPPRRSAENLVVIADLPSVYPKRRYIHSSVPVEPEPEWAPKPKPEPGPEPHVAPTEEAANDATAPRSSEPTDVPSAYVAGNPVESIAAPAMELANSSAGVGAPGQTRSVFAQPAKLNTRLAKGRKHRDQTESEDGDWTKLLSILSIALAGIALVLAQIPYGPWLASSVAIFALLIAGVCLVMRPRPIGGLAAVANAVFLAILLFMPSWLGLHPWLVLSQGQQTNRALAVGLDGRIKPTSGDWVDVTKASWQLDDVRATSAAPIVGPVTLVGPGGETRQTRQSFLIVRVHVGNVGAARELSIPDWRSASAVAPRLHDSLGLEIAAATFELGWIPKQPESRTVAPGRFADFFLYFEESKTPIEHFLLIIPGGPLELPEDIRLKLPRVKRDGR